MAAAEERVRGLEACCEEELTTSVIFRLRSLLSFSLAFSVSLSFSCFCYSSDSPASLLPWPLPPLIGVSLGDKEGKTRQSINQENGGYGLRGADQMLE